MKVFVTGVNGQLGHDVMNELAKRGYEAIGSDIKMSADMKYRNRQPHPNVDSALKMC